MISWLTGIPWGLIAFLAVCGLAAGAAIYLRQWRLLPWIALAAGLGVGWHTIEKWHEAYKERPSLLAKLEAEVECKTGSQCAKRVEDTRLEGERVNQEAVRKHEQEIEELRNRPIPHRVIRVCPATDHVRDATGSAGTGSGPAAEGVVHGEDEFDTRPLRELAQQADEVSARCRALLERDRRLAKTNRSD